MTILFWLIIATLISIAIYAIIPTLLNRSAVANCNADELNASIYQQKLLELEQAHQDGFLDAESLATAKDELARSLLNDTQERGINSPSDTTEFSYKSIITIATLMPLLAISLYLYKGQHLAIDADRYPRQSENGTNLSLETAIKQLEQKVSIGEADVNTWLMLGRGYLESNQLPKAEKAFARAYALEPNRIDTILDYAEILVRINENSFSEHAMQLVNKAAQIEPSSRRTRWLLSIIDMKKGNTSQALAIWQQLLAEGSNSPDEQKMLEMLITRNGGNLNTTTVEAPSIQVTVTIDATLLNRVAKTDSLFIFARAAQGPKMPLAVVRKSADQFPITVSLSDAQAMTPAMKLSNFENIIIGARISKTGNAIPASGDFQSLSAELSWKEQGAIALTISDIIP